MPHACLTIILLVAMVVVTYVAGQNLFETPRTFVVMFFFIAKHCYQLCQDNATVGTIKDHPHLALGQEMAEGLYKKYCPSS